MPKQTQVFSTSAAQLADLKKRLADALGEDADADALALVDETVDGFASELRPVVAKAAPGSEEEETGVDPDAELDNGAEPLQDVMLGLYDAVGKINKSKAPNKDELLKQAFDGAFGALNEVLTESVEAAGATAVAKKKKVAPAPTEDDPEDEEANMDKRFAPILKGATPAVRGLFAGVFKELGATRASLNAIVDERDGEKAVAEAKALGEPAAFAETLKRLKKLDPALAKSITTLIGTKNTTIRKSGLFKEIGGGNGETADAITVLNEHANEIVKNAAGKDASMTFAKAFRLACQQHPDVYAEYTAETRGR